MSSTAESLLKRTGKSLSILAFETSKQSRILKKRMRITALQKEVKADLRDLGRIVYEAVLKSNDDVLKNEDVTILVDNITRNNTEIDRLREAMERISRAKKTFDAEEPTYRSTPAATTDEVEVELEPEKAPEAAPAQKDEEKCCAKEGEPCAEGSAAAVEPAQVEAAADAAQAEPVLEEKPKPTRAKRTTTPRKRKSTKTVAKSSTKKEEQK